MVAFAAAVVTVSDGVAHGARDDRSGDLAEELLRGAGLDVVERAVVPDERSEIEARIRALGDAEIALICSFRRRTALGKRCRPTSRTRRGSG